MYCDFYSINKNKESKSTLKIYDFKLKKLPALTKLLTLASLQGIADTLSGEGIRFESFEMKSNSKGNLMNIEDALAMGPAVSILLNGYVDKGKVVSLRGTLVPATKLNSIIASIPLIGDILVGKVTPKGDSASGPEEKLLRSIFGEKAIDVTDTSLRMSRGSSGTVVDVRVFNRHGIEKDERSITIERAEIEEVQQDKIVEEEILERSIKQRASQILTGSSLNKKIKDIEAGTKLDFETISQININDLFKITPSNAKDETTLAQLKEQYTQAKQDITERFEDKVLKIRSGDDLLPSVMKMVKVFVAIKRRLRPGDKMSGRHGNKGVVSKIVPVEDMPYRDCLLYTSDAADE